MQKCDRPGDTSPSARLALTLGEAVTRLFDDAGASQIERLSALDVARALVALSDASLISPSCEPRPEAR